MSQDAGLKFFCRIAADSRADLLKIFNFLLDNHRPMRFAVVPVADRHYLFLDKSEWGRLQGSPRVSLVREFECLESEGNGDER